MKRLLCLLLCFILLFTASCANSENVPKPAALDYSFHTQEESSESAVVAEDGQGTLSVNPNGSFDFSYNGVNYTSSPEEEKLSGIKGPQKNRALSLFTATVLNNSDKTETTVYSSLLPELPEAADIPNGKAFSYSLTANTKIVIEITLNDGYLSVRVPMGGIYESNGEVIEAIQLLPGLLAGLSGDKGFLLIPDGCGAMVNFGLPAGTYNEPVYGADKAFTKDVLAVNKKQIVMPVYGIVNNGAGLLAVITGGSSIASVCAQKSGNLNAVYPMFTLRGSDSVEITTDAIQTIYEETRLFNSNIELRLYPSGGDWQALASTFKSYLTDDLRMDEISEKGKTAVIGIHNSYYDNGAKTLTDFTETEQILKEITDSYDGSAFAVLSGWESDGANGKITKAPDALPELGGVRGLKSLTDYCRSADIQLFGEINEAMLYKDSGNGAIRTLSGELAKQFNYSSASYTPINGGWYYLTPNAVTKSTAAVTNGFPLDGVMLSSIGNVLYSDFNKNELISREAAMNIFAAYLDDISAEKAVAAKGGQLYTAPYSSLILDLPNTSSGFTFVTKTVPFYQVALSGLCYYSSDAINQSSDPITDILFSLETASLLYWDIAYHLPETYNRDYSNKGYAAWKDSIMGIGREASAVLSKVAGEKITSLDDSVSGVVKTTYANGVTVTVNYNTGEFFSEGGTE